MRRTFAKVDVVVVATSGKGGVSMPFSRPFHLVRLPRPDLDDREQAWKAALARVPDGSAIPAGAAAELAGRYVIGPGAIAEVVGEATQFARAAATKVDGATLEEA